jgi:hypothetical protein
MEFKSSAQAKRILDQKVICQKVKGFHKSRSARPSLDLQAVAEGCAGFACHSALVPVSWRAFHYFIKYALTSTQQSFSGSSSELPVTFSAEAALEHVLNHYRGRLNAITLETCAILAQRPVISLKRPSHNESHTMLLPLWHPITAILLLFCSLTCAVANSSKSSSCTGCIHKDAFSSEGGLLLGGAAFKNLTQRAHPPAAALSLLSPADQWELVQPSFPEVLVQPWVVALASALFFWLLYRTSSALHSYLTDDIALSLSLQRAESKLQLKSSFNSSAFVSVIPAAIHVAPPRSPRSWFDSYLYAYAATSQTSLVAAIEWNSRLMSNVHAAVSCLLGLLCLCTSTSRISSEVVTQLAEARISRSDISSDVKATLLSAAALPYVSRSGPSLLNPLSSSFTHSLVAFNEDPLRDFSLMVTCGYLTYDLGLCLWVRWKFRGVEDVSHRDAAPTASVTATNFVPNGVSSTTSNPMSPSPSPLPPVDSAPASAARLRKQRHASAPRSTSVKLDDALTLTHHILIIVAFSLGTLTHIGTTVMAAFLLNEASTPFLNLNFFLAAMRSAGLWSDEQNASQSFSARTMSLLYKLNGVALLLLFLLFRVCFNLAVLVTLLLTWIMLPNLWIGHSAPIPPFVLAQCALLSTLAAGHCAINLAWFHALAKAVQRKLFAGATKKRKQQ